MNHNLTRRAFTQILGGAALAGPRLINAGWTTPPGTPAAETGSDIFPFGTHVYREPHLSIDQLRADFPVLKRLGFNMIKIQEVWAYDERRDGQIDISNVSQVVADARQNGLQVYFGVTMENPPAWLWKKYPDATMVYETGQPHNDPTLYVLPADGKPGPCWHHPGAREAAIRFIEAVGREIGKYDNIRVWNLFQEIGLWPPRPGHLGLCFCPHTLQEFRTWLRTQYKDIDELNNAWRCAYGDWEEVEPPRSSPKVPPTIDWRYFMDDVYLTDVLKWKGDAFRRSDPLHHPILAHVGGTTEGSTREWRYAEQLDVLGSSCYPAWGPVDLWDARAPSAEKPLTEEQAVNHELEGLLINFDHLRSASRSGEIWTAELQGGPIVEGLGRKRVPDPADIRRWVLACLSTGVHGICFWNHRPEIFWEEGYGFSLLDWGSDTSARAEEAGRLSKAINAHAALFSKGKHAQPGGAILLNEGLYHFAESSEHEALHHLQFTIQGIWKSLWLEGIPCGFVEAANVPTGPGDCKALIMPFPLTLGPKLVEGLQTYVRNGGIVIAEACPGRFNNYGIGGKGAMMSGVAELFGATHQGVFLIREPNKGAKWTAHDLAPRDHRDYRDLAGVGDFAAHSVFPAYYLQTLTLTTGQPILKYDAEIAGCVNSYGKGRAYLVGTLLGHGVAGYDDLRNAKFLAAVLERAGVPSDSVGALKRRRRVWGNQAAWFLFNLTDKPVGQEVSIEGYKSAEDLMGGVLPATGGRIQIRVDPFDVKCLVLEA
jgi:beta-galactosidase GanA